MAGLALSVVTPTGVAFEQQVDEVTVPGLLGEFGVLPNHAPVMSVIKPGALKVLNDGTERRIFVNGGFADVTPEGLTVLAEEAIDLEDISADKIEQDLKAANEDLRDASSDAKKDAAQRAVARLEAIKAVMAR